MKPTTFFLMLLLSIVVMSSCDDDDSEIPFSVTNCDFFSQVSENLYANAPNDQLSIIEMEISEDCLSIQFSSGGCDGSTWETLLIDSGQLLESFPVQRNLRLSLSNMELCDAVITKTLSFDLVELQIADANQVILNITNSGEQLLYEY